MMSDPPGVFIALPYSRSITLCAAMPGCWISHRLSSIWGFWLARSPWATLQTGTVSMLLSFVLFRGEICMQYACMNTWRFNSLRINIPCPGWQNPANVIFISFWAGNFTRSYLLILFWTLQCHEKSFCCGFLCFLYTSGPRKGRSTQKWKGSIQRSFLDWCLLGDV